VSTTKTQNISLRAQVNAKVGDLAALIKFRLSATVVFSATIAYVLASGFNFSIMGLMMIALGGMLVTAAANTLNEVIEKDYDRLMSRTANRPLPAGRMSTMQAILAAGLFGVGGLLILAFYFNQLAAILGAVSLLTYAFIYTPMKRFTNFAVMVGAVPGALPIVIGWVAYTGTITPIVYVLFAIQFMWQFPHFWAIAWLAHDDYQKAGYNLLPSTDGRSKTSAAQILIYSIFLLPVSLIPYFIGFMGWPYAVLAAVAGGLIIYFSFKLYYLCNRTAAKHLMLAALIYLPVLFTAMIIDKII
jgi:protoheme IX farnesyltransferase